MYGWQWQMHDNDLQLMLRILAELIYIVIKDVICATGMQFNKKCCYLVCRDISKLVCKLFSIACNTTSVINGMHSHTVAL